VGPFTSWIQHWRMNHELPFPPEVAERLAETVFKQLRSELSRRIAPRLGQTDPDDAVARQITVFMERLRDPDRLLPQFVKDSTSLHAWMFSEIWSRYCREWKRPGPALHGLSGFPKLSDGSCDPQALENHLNAKRNADEIGLEMREIIDLALADLLRWRGPTSVEHFVQVVLQDRTQRQAAMDAKTSESTVNRSIKQASFCFARRLGWSPAQLAQAYGPSIAENWRRAIEGN
jgi:DNA-directed RNA polymerase specialized sigma24 family protein